MALALVSGRPQQWRKFKLFQAIIHPYVDDSAVAETPDLAWDQYNALLELMDTLGLAAALDKGQAPDTQLVWIGVLFNSLTMIMSIDR